MIPDWFTSDLHFGHANVIAYSNRPFSSVQEMNRELVRRYNSLVSPRDTVMFVGDVFFLSVEEAKTVLASMHGRKILVRGNHDKSAAAMARVGFDVVVDSATLELSGHTVRVSHYPYRSQAHPGDFEKVTKAGLEFPVRRPGEALIHGHKHSTNRREGRAVHVGVDAWDYYPASRYVVMELVREAFA